MKSPKNPDLLDLETGIKLTAEDSVAQDLYRPGPMTMDEYLAFVASFGGRSYEELRARTGPSGPSFRLR